jgi:hypothetical protein
LIESKAKQMVFTQKTPHLDQAQQAAAIAKQEKDGNAGMFFSSKYPKK